MHESPPSLPEPEYVPTYELLSMSVEEIAALNQRVTPDVHDFAQALSAGEDVDYDLTEFNKIADDLRYLAQKDVDRAWQIVEHLFRTHVEVNADLGIAALPEIAIAATAAEKPYDWLETVAAYWAGYMFDKSSSDQAVGGFGDACKEGRMPTHFAKVMVATLAWVGGDEIARLNRGRRQRYGSHT